MDAIGIQIIGFVAMAFCIGSYQVKSGRGLILCKTAGDLLYVVHYLLLGSYSGCVTLGVSAVNQIVYSFRGRQKWADWKGWRWLFSGLMVAAYLLVWRGSFRISNVFAMVSMLSVSLTTWSDNAQVMRVNKLFLAGPLWVVYTIAAGSISNLLCEVIGMASAATGIYRYRRNARIEKRQCMFREGKSMELIDKDRQGMVLRIERSSIHDGDGFRTVVFLKGCPLRCQWCSTPESQSFEVENTESGSYGTLMTVDEVMRELRKDSLFFFISGGGVTLSGGEVLAQPEFSAALLKNCCREGINTAIETSFFSPWNTVESILQYVNTAYVDLKLFSVDRHRKYCGAGNSLILENLLNTSDCQGNFRLVVRTPIIPAVNDSEEDLRLIGKFCTSLKRLDHIQLLPYHNLGTATYEKLGRPYELSGTPTPTEEHMARCREIVGSCGVKVR